MASAGGTARAFSDVTTVCVRFRTKVRRDSTKQGVTLNILLDNSDVSALETKRPPPPSRSPWGLHSARPPLDESSIVRFSALCVSSAYQPLVRISSTRSATPYPVAR
eukprot:scaffold28_cov312-Pinguiococcus_pyrenoidosus.AAC.2